MATEKPEKPVSGSRHPIEMNHRNHSAVNFNDPGFPKPGLCATKPLNRLRANGGTT
jgi:hypothetical protein